MLAGRTEPVQVKGSRQGSKARRVRPEPPQPGRPEATLPNLDDVRSRLPLPVQVPPPVPSTMRSRRKPLVSRHGRRVGDPLPLPTPTPAVPTPTPFLPPAAGGGINPSGSNSPSSLAGTDLFAFYSPRFLVSPSDDQFRSLSGSFFGPAAYDLNPSFDFFALSMLQAGGTRIVFASNREGNVQIYTMNADGSGQARLTYDGGNDDYPRWSPSGAKILFQSDRDNPGTGYNDIYTMNSDGTGQVRLTADTNDNCAPSWSSDGSKVVFQSLRDGQHYQIYSMNADGSGQLNLSNSSGNDRQPSWSPNGAKIAFASDRDHTGFASVYVMNGSPSAPTM